MAQPMPDVQENVSFILFSFKFYIKYSSNLQTVKLQLLKGINLNLQHFNKIKHKYSKDQGDQEKIFAVMLVETGLMTVMMAITINFF